MHITTPKKNEDNTITVSQPTTRFRNAPPGQRFKDKRTKRNRTRSQQRRRALAE